MSVKISRLKAGDKLNYDPFTVIEEGAKNTPDWSNLNFSDKDEFPVFVFGHLRRMRKDNYLLDGCNYYGQADTWDATYILKRGPYESKQFTPEPMLFNFPNSDKKLKEEFKDDFDYGLTGVVQGDMYGVPLRTLAMIDEYLANTEGVNRKEVFVQLKQSKRKDVVVTRSYIHTVDMSHYREYSVYHGGLLSSGSYIPQQGPRVYYFAS